MRITTIVIAFMALLALDAAEAAGALPLPVRYTCEDGSRLRVTFSTPGTGPGTALVRLLGTAEELKLVQAPSADGGRYTAKEVEFWDKGPTATFTRHAVALVCRPKR